MIAEHPQLGEVCLLRELRPTRSQKGAAKAIWHACVGCGTERWVVLAGGAPKTERCHLCSQATRRGQFVKLPSTYAGAHARVRRVRGRAATYTCACGVAARDWAYNHEDPCPNEITNSRGQRFSGDVYKYIALCKSCHVRWDNPPLSTHCRLNHEYTPENTRVSDERRRCRACERHWYHQRPPRVRGRAGGAR